MKILCYLGKHRLVYPLKSITCFGDVEIIRYCLYCDVSDVKIDGKCYRISGFLRFIDYVKNSKGG